MKKSYWILAVAMVVALSAGSAFAQDYKTQTAADPTVSVTVLNHLLTPLTAEELGKEAAVWRGLLKAKVEAICKLNIAKENKETVDDAQLTSLRGDRAALIERLNAVLAAWKEKGGDPAEFEKYVASRVAGSVTEELEAPTSVEGASKLVTKATDWVVSTEGGIKWGLNILKFLVILLAFKIVANILGGVVRRAVTKVKTSDLLKDFFVNTIKKVTFFVGLVIALGALGINIGPLVAGIGALGLVVGFALSDTLGNFASGIMILLYRPYDIGNVVSAGGVTGKVDAMSLVSTTVKTPDNQTVIVPNSKIWGDVITNITGNDTRRVDLVFGIGYDDDIDKAQKVLEEVVASHDKVLKDPATVIKVHELADSSVNFVCRPWSKTSDYWDVYWDLTRMVKERFDKESISIPFPQRDVHMYQQSS